MRVSWSCPLFLLALIVTAWAATDFRKASTPTLLWGSQNFGPAATRVNYESLLLSDVWDGLMKSFKGVDSATDGILAKDASTPEITVVFVGNQMRPSDLGEMKPLQSTLRKSSALLFPNTVYEGTGDNFAQLLAENGGIDVELVGSCATTEESQNIAEAVEGALARSSENDAAPRVVVVCSASDSLAGELTDFGVVMSALEAASKEYVMMYVSHESASDGVNGAKRNLLADETNRISYDVCEGLCMTQVKFLEGIILAMILAFALSAGLCCTHILDGPSQFEKPEGEAS
ncbi:hypothetical protein BSKO_04086 [Bryopsis sp. KO-2023]|nr:hypothetical protein BSKO_04086 [Bryopsis sp. KO-2023]